MNGPAPLQAWRVWLPGVLLLAIMLALFRGTATEMVSIWIRSETFQHAFLVAPVAAWLVWRKRAELASIRLQAVPWLLLPMAIVCLAWLLGSLAEVAAATQFALVTLIILAVPTLYGWRLARLLAFPLLFLYFLVPFGEFTVPYLQEWTADVTVLALRLTGIPVYREGMQFMIPSGTWSVIEACSGIRYLIACFMVGTLFAYLNYRSMSRRLLFVVAALVVPVAANWLRAYTIVMIGHLTGSPMILGVEHTTYGWFLFGAVVMVLFWVGGRWAEVDAPQRSPAAAPALDASEGRATGQLAFAGVLALLVATQAWLWALEREQDQVVPRVQLPQGQAGWEVDSGPTALEWKPGFVNPSATALRVYRNGRARVDVWAGYYRQQNAERKLATSIHRVVSVEEHAWRTQLTGVQPAAGALPAFSTSIVSQGATPSVQEGRRSRTWHVYWLDGRWLLRPSEIRLRQALGRLAGRGDDGAVLMLLTDMTDEADAVLEKFARENLDALGASLKATRDSRTSHTP